MDAMLDKLLGMIPRKLVACLVAMWLVQDTAIKLQVDGYARMFVIAGQVVIALYGIYTHYLLELKNPTPNGIAK